MNYASEPLNPDAAPTPGDLSLCGFCGEILQFRPDMSVELMPEDMIAELPAEYLRHITKTQKMIRNLTAIREILR